MSRYSATEIEAKWQQSWNSAGTFQATRDASKPKYYVLEMFPYPSGRIHMGHVRNYTMGDVIARYKLSTGHNVLHPMGWDGYWWPSKRLDLQQYRRHAGPNEAAGSVNRLVTRIRHL